MRIPSTIAHGLAEVQSWSSPLRNARGTALAIAIECRQRHRATKHQHGLLPEVLVGLAAEHSYLGETSSRRSLHCAAEMASFGCLLLEMVVLAFDYQQLYIQDACAPPPSREMALY
jgi:hypothetical protein